MNRSISFAALAVYLLLPGIASERERSGYREWKVYGGGPEGIRYSTLNQINRDPGPGFPRPYGPGYALPALWASLKSPTGSP